MLLSKLRIGSMRLFVLGSGLFTFSPAQAEQDNVKIAQESALTERGTFEAVKSSEVVCHVSAPKATIKWIIAEGTKVKKGDKLVEIDDSYYVEIQAQQKTVVVKAEVDHKRAAENLDRIKEQNQIDVKVAQIDVRLATIALKQFKGDDATAKEALELQLNRASLLVDRIKLSGAAKENEASVELEGKKASLDTQIARQREIEMERSNCILTAPQDGLATLYPPAPRQGPVAVGSRVFDGRKLMVVSDLTKMAFHSYIPEDVIVNVHQGQKATLRVDAFPKRTLTGTVHEVATKSDRIANQTSSRLYKVIIIVDGVNDFLKPGMSGDATILTAGNAKSP